MAIGFTNFEAAFQALPHFIIFDHPRTISDLAFLVQHEIDLFTEGETNDIECKRRSDTTKRYQKCKAYLARCAASGVAVPQPY